MSPASNLPLAKASSSLQIFSALQLVELLKGVFKNAE